MGEIIRQMEAESITPSDMFANWIVKGIYSNSAWLFDFKKRAGIFDSLDAPVDNSGMPYCQFFPEDPQHSPTFPLGFNINEMLPTTNSATALLAPLPPDENTIESTQNMTMFDMNGRPTVLLPDDVNFHRVFENDLRRWVAATMSPKNPRCHVPSDEEIQHQGRWIMYNGDDPWNQTPADFTEWLWRFKRDVGILNNIDVVNPAELTRHQQ
jgi:hypothetical protein